jgi:hypothetical protein
MMGGIEKYVSVKFYDHSANTFTREMKPLSVGYCLNMICLSVLCSYFKKVPHLSYFIERRIIYCISLLDLGKYSSTKSVIAQCIML